MTRILLDYLNRWRWVWAAYFLVFGCLAFFTRNLLSFFPLALVLLSVDARTGVLYTFRLQPVSRQDQDRAWWFICVCLPTLLSTPLLALGLFWQQASFAPAPLPGLAAPWFSLAVVTFLGTGLSALMFLIWRFILPRKPETKMEWAVTVPCGTLWGLMIPGCFMLRLQLPGTPAEAQTWQWIVLALIPPLVAFSYVQAGKVTQSRLKVAAHTQAPAPVNAITPASGSRGLLLFLLTLHGRLLTLLLFFASTFWALRLWRGRTITAEEARQINDQLVITMMVVPAVVADWFSLRMLRSVPLSTRRLTLALLSVPIMLGLLAASQTALTGAAFFPNSQLGMESLNAALVTAGVSATLLTFNSYVGSSWRFVIMLLPLSIMVAGTLTPDRSAPWMSAIGGLMLLASAHFLQRGFWHGSAYYRPRRAFGLAAADALGRP
ncbi:MAG: hypothetical protein V4599_03640 [Verrucomicrobiota bacterium]